MMKRLRDQMAIHGAAIELTDEAKELLVEQGYDPAMGARPLRRVDPAPDRRSARGLRARPRPRARARRSSIDRRKDADRRRGRVAGRHRDRSRACREPETVTCRRRGARDPGEPDSPAPSTRPRTRSERRRGTTARAHCRTSTGGPYDADRARERGTRGARGLRATSSRRGRRSRQQLLEGARRASADARAYVGDASRR